MNIGIIVYSRTGNTLEVAGKVRDAFLAQGYSAVIERITADNEDPNNKLPIQLKTVPDPAQYDAVIFGAPVQAFSLSPIMAAYGEQMPMLAGTRIGCFVTQHFPKPWMGGKQAIRKLCKLADSKGARIAETGIVNWTSKVRSEQINDLAASFVKVGEAL